jgi:hypothetical protein
MPLVARLRMPSPELIRILPTTFATPLTNRFSGHRHSTFWQELYYIPEAEAEAKVQPHGMADDLGGKTMIFRASGWGCGTLAQLCHTG